MRNYSIKQIGGPGYGGFYSKQNNSVRSYKPQDTHCSNGGIDYESMTARDERMYNQTEFSKNILLENTKDERQELLRAKKLNSKGRKIILQNKKK